MTKIVVGPRVAMDWLRDASKAASAADLPVCWTTPTGFLVQQRYPDLSRLEIRTKVGQKSIKLWLWEEEPTLNKRKQAQAIAPNYVHSLDAAALALTVVDCGRRGITSFVAIHDSYGTLAADMDELADSLRRQFVAMYEQDVLEKFREELLALVRTSDPKAEIDPVPAKGILDLTGVLRSEFFFA